MRIELHDSVNLLSSDLSLTFEPIFKSQWWQGRNGAETLSLCLPLYPLGFSVYQTRQLAFRNTFADESESVVTTTLSEASKLDPVIRQPFFQIQWTA